MLEWTFSLSVGRFEDTYVMLAYDNNLGILQQSERSSSPAIAW